MSKYDMIPTGKKSKYGQPLYECAECTEKDINTEGHTVTYWLISAQLCYDHFQEYHAWIDAKNTAVVISALMQKMMEIA